ncbi:MAG: hypothetical protein RLZZ531_1315 [Bacteroidota bacterium]
MCMKSILFTTFISVYFICLGQNAIQLDGLNDIVTVNYPGILGDNPRTVEAWIKTTSNYNPNTGGVQGVISDWGTFTNSNRSTFNVLFNNAIRFEVNGNGVNGTIPVNDGNWHHVAMVYDPLATLKVSLYVDGVLDVAGNLTIPVNTLSSFVRIGQRVDGLHFFNGKIDEYRLWSVALTQAQIIANKDKELCHLNDPNLKLYYTFNQGLASGINTGQTIVHDWSPNQKDGILTNVQLTGSSSNWVSGQVLNPGFSASNSILSCCGAYTSSLDNQVYSTSGVYTINGLNQSGCDSIQTLNLTVTPTFLTSFTAASCGSYVWPQNGQNYSSTGIYFDTLTAQNGCDSILKLDLTITSISSNVIHVFSCNAYTWTQTGNTYMDSGTYSDTLSSISGCDSVIVLLLDIYPQVSTNLTVTSCNSYYWSLTNMNYTNAGDYSAVLSSTYGCDSTVTLHLSFNQSDTTNQLLSACFPITWQEAGIVMDHSGIFTHTFTNVNGCDSIVQIDFSLNILTASVALDETTGNISAIPLGAIYTLISCENNNDLVTWNSPNFDLPSNGIYAVVVNQNGCVDTSDCVIFSSANLSNQTEGFLRIFPNPCQDALLIHLLNEDMHSFYVFDTKGACLIQQDFSSAVKDCLISTKELLPGIYFLKVNGMIIKFMKE